MTWATLDKIFPYVVLGYGVILTATLNSPLAELAAARLPAPVARQLFAHRGLGLLCLVVGAAWSMQSLWLDV